MKEHVRAQIHWPHSHSVAARAQKPCASTRKRAVPLPYSELRHIYIYSFMRLLSRLLGLALAVTVRGSIPEEQPEEQQQPEVDEELVPSLAPEAIEPEVREDITDQRASLFDRIEGFFGQPKKWIQSSKARGAKPLGAARRISVSMGWAPKLDVWKEDTVVSCDCCTDHLLGDPRAQASLLYKSGKDRAAGSRGVAAGATWCRGWGPG
eukprot:Skav205838  [mRNA]  locus=scaffold160:403735:409735:+ [translate_table: standard]